MPAWFEKIRNCIIEENYAPQGGGVHFHEAISILENSVIRKNVAANAGGGTAILRGSSVTIYEAKH